MAIDFDAELNDFMKVRDSISEGQRQKQAAAEAERKFALEIEKFMFDKETKLRELSLANKKDQRESEAHPLDMTFQKAQTEKFNQEAASEKVKRLKSFREAQYMKKSSDALDKYGSQSTPQTTPQVGNAPLPGQQINPNIPQPTQAGVSFGPSGATITPKSEAEKFLQYQEMLKSADEPRRYKIEQTVKRLSAIESDPFVQDFQEIDRNVTSLIDLNHSVKSGDVKFGGEYTAGIMNLYQRLVDPKGVVRSGDLDLIVKNLGLRRQWNIAVQKITKGGALDQEGAETILKIGASLGNTYGKKYNSYIDSKTGVAEHLGYDKEVLEKSLPRHKPYVLDTDVKVSSIEDVLAPYRKTKNGNSR